MIIAKLLENGGHLLAVGGGLSKLPSDLINNPRLIIWDDEVSGSGLNKTVPSNTRAIVFNRFTSHSLVMRLRNAAKSLHIPIFPVPTSREMREVLHSIFQEENVHIVDNPEEQGVGIAVSTSIPTIEPTTEIQETDMKSFERGEAATFVSRNAALYPEAGVTTESNRLVELAKKQGYKTTRSAISQQIYKLRDKTSKIIKTTKTAPTGDKAMDDLAEFQNLLENAKTAIDLLVEHLPKVMAEVKSGRERIEKIRSFLDRDK